MNNKLSEKYNLINSLVEKIDDEKLNVLSKFLKNRIMNVDSYVMMLGETSSGKSTIINGLMQENVLFVSSAPSTGAITEVEFKADVKENEFYAINKDATIEEIDCDMFNELLKEPDDKLERVKLVTKSTKYKLDNMRLFDTPGYGSIVKAHEEILKEFIPNSDVIIYTVNYRIGIQENDYAFLGFLKELVRDDVEILLLINRCPAKVSKSDRRVAEILRYVNDILHDDIPVFFVETERLEDEDAYPLPQATSLWSYVEKLINSLEREKVLEEVFNGYILDLFYKCEAEIENRYENIKLSQELKDEIRNCSKAFVDNVNNLIPNDISPTFDRLKESIPKELESARNKAEKKVITSIKNMDKISMDEMIPYVNNHLLPFSIQQETLEVKRYLEIELNDLNDRINDYLNTQLMEFNKEISICFSTVTEFAAKGMGKKIGNKALTGGLTRYFAGFGGVGGSGAGVANAASHALKATGDIFGKTFSRQTHNALKHTLRKIGATSSKAISTAAVVIIELATVIIDYNTWQGKLKTKVTKAIDEWYSETLNNIQEDLEKLKAENIDTLNAIVAEELEIYNYKEEISNETETVKLIDMLEEIKQKIGV
ncbi:dynamin family protein [Haloimpatiens sp. FM7315]|uniref:dynamin family protein n=1 Tax=Haloimpatiens sp. FM7315 TaxID=3298609 RepID=UPI0035A3CD53